MDDETRTSEIKDRVVHAPRPTSGDTRHYTDVDYITQSRTDTLWLLDRLRAAEAERDAERNRIASSRYVDHLLRTHEAELAAAEARAAEAEAVIAEALTGLRASGEPDWPGWNVVEGVERILSRYRAGADHD